MHDENYYKNIMAKILNRSLENNPLLAKELIIAMFEDPDIAKRAELICEASKKEQYKNSIIVIKSVKINAMTLLKKICNREKIGFIPIFFRETGQKIMKSGERVNVLILSKQESEFNQAYLEALIMSGDMASADSTYLSKLENTYKKIPIIKLQNVNKDMKERIVNEIKKLPPMMKYCIFSDKHDQETISFFSQTQEMKIQTEDGLYTTGPYPTLDILCLILLRSFLPEKETAEFIRMERYNQELIKTIRMELETQEKPYMIPCKVNSDLSISPEFKNVIEYKEEDLDIIIEDIKKRLKVPNLTFVVMPEKEYLKLRISKEGKDNIDLRKDEFYKDRNIPIYIDPEIAAKDAFLQKIREELEEIRSENERNSIIEEILKEKAEPMSLDQIVSEIIDKRTDWETELYKDTSTKALEKTLIEKFKNIICEQIQPKEPQKHFVTEHEIDDEDLEL